jgi:hypothetical protein
MAARLPLLAGPDRLRRFYSSTGESLHWIVPFEQSTPNGAVPGARADAWGARTLHLLHHSSPLVKKTRMVNPNLAWREILCSPTLWNGRNGRPRAPSTRAWPSGAALKPEKRSPTFCGAGRTCEAIDARASVG